MYFSKLLFKFDESLGGVSRYSSNRGRDVVRRPVGELDWIGNQVHGQKERKICL